MARTITIGSTQPEPDTVVLFDHRYTTRRITRTVQKQLQRAEEKFEEWRVSDDTDTDKAVAILAEGLGVMLEPAPTADGEPDTRSVKQVVMKAWKEDLLQISDLDGAFRELARGPDPT